MNADPKGRKKEKTRTTIVKASVFKRESSQDMISVKISDISEDLLIHPYEKNFTGLNEDIEILENWNFSVWALKTDNDKFRLIYAMFQAFNYFEKLDLDQNRFASFLCVIRDKYNIRQNPFHNFDHGFTG